MRPGTANAPDTERKLLATHPPRGATALPGCASALIIVFGLPFMAAGALLSLVAQGMVAAKPDLGSPPPPWVVHALALVFFAPGLFLCVTGVRAILAARRHRRGQADHPREPWLADGWTPEGTPDRTRQTLLSQVIVSAFLAAFLAPFNYFVFLDAAGTRAAPLFAKGIVGFFDFILALVLASILATLWHRARYGRSRLSFGSFPFFLGQTLAVRLSTGRSLGSFQDLAFTLRCIEERAESRGTANRRSTRTVCEQVWAAKTTLAASWALHEGEIPVSFRLPEGDYGTRLDEPPVRYWEIEVTADTPGLDFGAVFPVPVYARPRA